MNIKEIIDGEYWMLNSRDAYEHNAALDRIEAAVSYHIVDGNKMVSDLRNPSDGWVFERVVNEQDPVVACVAYNMPNMTTLADQELMIFVQTAHMNFKKDAIAAHNADIARKDQIIGELFRQDLKHCEEYARDREEWSDEEQQYKARIAELERTAQYWEDEHLSGNKRIAELEEQNLNMMALFRDFYELEFNRDECWEIIKKYGGDA